MRKLCSLLIAFTLLIGFATPTWANSQSDLDAAITRTASYILRTVRNPGVGEVGGDWAILGLARSGHPVPELYFSRYLGAVERHTRANNGVLDQRRVTEHSRVILGLTAAGFDPRDVAGFDLLAPLRDFDRVVWQGINGPIFALLALDSLDYPSELREQFVEEILNRQLADGGWNLTGERGDPGITGMALQALAKYRDDPEVAAAVRRGLTFISRAQEESGGFSGNVESAVQVLVALTELNISIDNPRFVKNGNTVLDNILSFGNADGSFHHSRDSTESNLMATEQALYGLAAARRATNGQNSLYRMSDRVVR